jgi:hypothetical protein
MKGFKDFSAKFFLVEVDEVIEIADKMCETSQVSANVVLTDDFDFCRRRHATDLYGRQGDTLLLVTSSSTTSSVVTLNGKVNEFSVEFSLVVMKLTVMGPDLREQSFSKRTFLLSNEIKCDNIGVTPVS